MQKSYDRRKIVFDYYKDDPNSTSSILYGNNECGKVLGSDKVVFAKDITLDTVLLVETLGYNLIYVHQLAICGFDTTFSLHYVKVFRSDNLKVAFFGHVKNILYVVDFSKESTHLLTCLMAKADVGWLWHRRLAHIGMRNLKQLLKGEHVVGLTDVSFEKDRPCSACIAGKQKEKFHPAMTTISISRPLELLDMDLFGPSYYDSLGGQKYGLVIVDGYSRDSWACFLKSKEETHKEFITFAKQAERDLGFEIKAIRNNNGSEFKNYSMKDFIEEGIKHQFSAPYTPQQNG
jgi:hypothetical protein